MKLNTLSKISDKKKRRIGMGHGSGRGKTAGRGTKGQNARGKVPLYFEGGAVPLIKRLPFRRGKGRNKVFKKKPIGINVKALNLFPKNSTVDVASLIKRGIVYKEDALLYGVKILGDGELSVALKVALPCSKGAQKKIEKAHGECVNDPSNTKT
ncbi:MAG: 50S ribosomal protein L15 [Candidatus Levybacteria bacterium RIFCSPHIGHO2_02_FULL_42_12]|nr:MAG: 50S ribosomal protein L15 [Candidatus Levybacteria bacterium RIFCSPHIGHO2_01_FULL_42_15]OGH31428.1 MAG: 50S ribosomal protein L15 [Candidatus Levybacteria bacterium RIFCSPHIGHO2_02_FULL_42_12]OGH42692.1 MAG: 50S ribosomal protein L15 [Candidatus Levybacteria bacterium RIFCSPLOWO2_01_FULL_42_15]